MRCIRLNRYVTLFELKPDVKYASPNKINTLYLPPEPLNVGLLLGEAEVYVHTGRHSGVG